MAMPAIAPSAMCDQCFASNEDLQLAASEITRLTTVMTEQQRGIQELQRIQEVAQANLDLSRQNLQLVENTVLEQKRTIAVMEYSIGGLAGMAAGAALGVLAGVSSAPVAVAALTGVVVGCGAVAIKRSCTNQR